MGKKIIFINAGKKRTLSCFISYDCHDESFNICYWDLGKSSSSLKYSIEDTIIFSLYDDGSIYVRSQKYRSPSYHIGDGGGLGSSAEPRENLLYGHISEAFKIFDDINAECKSKGKDPVWMLELDLDNNDLSAVLNVALTRLFDSFTLSGPACDEAITTLYRDYCSTALYNMMMKNLKPDRYSIPKLRAIDPSDYWPESLLTEEGKALYNKIYLICSRGNGKNLLAQQLYRMILNSTYGIRGGSNMNNKLRNFRKSIEEIKRDKKNPGKFLIEYKDGAIPFPREIVCNEFSKEELYSEEFIESILVIAIQMQYDRIEKVIFNKEEKLTIIFPNNPYNFSVAEKIIVKATGLDGFDLLCGYSIAKAKMLCSGDGYQWYNKLRKSGKVDV